MILLAVYFIFTLEKGNDVRQRANSSNFLIWVQNGSQSSEDNSAMHLAQELLTHVQCSDGSRCFAREMRALKIRSTVASSLKLTTTNCEPSSKVILLQLHEKLLKSSVSTTLWPPSIWSKLGRWKSLINECLMSWPKITKIVDPTCCLFLLYATTNNCWIRLCCVT